MEAVLSAIPTEMYFRRRRRRRRKNSEDVFKTRYNIERRERKKEREREREREKEREKETVNIGLLNVVKHKRAL